MADPRIIDTVTADSIDFKISFWGGQAHLVFAPQTSPVRDPNGTQAEQSQGRITITLPNGGVAYYDIVPSADSIPSFAPVVSVQDLYVSEDGIISGQFVATDLDDNLDSNSWVQVGSVTGFTLNTNGSFTYDSGGAFDSLGGGDALDSEDFQTNNTRAALISDGWSLDASFDLDISGSDYRLFSGTLADEAEWPLGAAAQVEGRMTHRFSARSVGAVAASADALLLETADTLLLENGDRLLLE